MPENLATTVTGETLQLSILADGTNIAAGQTTEVVIARADPAPKTLNYELQLVDGSGNIDADFMPGNHDIFVADGEGIVSASDADALTFDFWPSTDNEGVTFSVNLSDTQGGGIGTIYTASVDTAPFNVEASRLVAFGDPGVEPLDSGDDATTSATITQTLQAVAGPAGCQTNEMLPCVVDLDFPGDALVAAVLTSGFAHGLSNLTISLADINFVNGQADASLLVEGGAIVEGTTPVVSITFSVNHSIYGDFAGLPLVFTLEDTAFDFDFNGDGNITATADYAILFFWAGSRSDYQSALNRGQSAADAARSALNQVTGLGLLSEGTNLASGVEKLLAVLPPGTVRGDKRFDGMDFNGDGNITATADYAILFFWAGSRSDYQSALNRGESAAAARRTALNQVTGLGLLSEGTNLASGAEKLLAILPPD